MREKTGGLEHRFNVTRTDGKPCRPEARYLVLDYATDPHARVAVQAYASSIWGENQALADDLVAALADPSSSPPQHE